MKIIACLSLYLPINIKHEIKLEKIEQQQNIDIRGSPNMVYIHEKGCIFYYYEIDLKDYMASSHMHHIKLHSPIMSQSCVCK